MAYKFETMSGAVYEVRDGRITRIGDQPILSYSTGREAALVIVNEPFRFEGGAPTVGEYFRFFLPGQPENSPIRTSEVLDRWEVDETGAPGRLIDDEQDALFALAAQARQALAAKALV